MTGEELSALCDARDKLCSFCKADECETCIVTQLINDAYNELPDEDSGPNISFQDNCQNIK